MEIKCVRCEKKFQIDNERLVRIRALQLEEMSPADYLDFFPLIAGRCGRKGFEDKKHSFVFTDEYKESIREILKENGKLIGVREKLDIEKTNIEALGTKLIEEGDGIRKRLDEIREQKYKIDHEINDISVKLLDNERDLAELGKKFEDLTGESEIKIWSTVILPG